MSVRTRFAPSPTGSLHVGNVRTAVLNWLFARHHGGAFIVRIEDTDVERNVAGAESALLEDLRWLGLDWDAGPDGGPHGPYRQSERGPLYREHALRLRELAAAYPCFCAPEAGERTREDAVGRDEGPRPRCACRGLAGEEAARREAEGERPALRFRAPLEGEVVVDDIVRGRVRFDAAELDDFVIVRSDGVATYNFAVVVDDALMRISHVIRGVGHLSNTPRQLLLYRALGWEPPAFAHIPTVLGSDRQKLSKRAGARPLSEYRAEGYHPDALVNYLSLLSWSSPSGDEILSRERLVREISLERIRSADAVFDPEKLRWLSARHIEAMPLEELVAAVKPFADASGEALPEEALPTAVEAVRSHLGAFSDIGPLLRPFVPSADPAETARRADLLGPGDARVLLAAADRLEAVDRWEMEALTGALKQAGKDADAKGPGLYVPLRKALTGEEHGPPLAAVLRAQGREAALGALRRVAGAAV